MTTAQEMFALANSLFDELRFEEAVSIYQKATLEDPKSYAFANLMIAHSTWQIHFANTLIEKYPDSISALIDKIMVLNNEQVQANQAVELCTNALNNLELTHGQRTRFTELRFRPAIKVGIGEYLKDDFVLIWQSLSGSKGKRKLLEELLSATSISLKPVFSELAQDTTFTPSIRNLFEKKAQLLLLLKDIDNTELMEN